MKEIIEKGYQLFKNYQPEFPLDICTVCCINDEEYQELTTKNVRDLSSNLLATYNNGAHSDRTPTVESKYFLPRFLELIAQYDFPSHSEEITLSRLKPISREEWKLEEWNFLGEFSLEFFKICFRQRNQYFFDLNTVLIMFWNGGFDLQPLLDYWYFANSQLSLLHYKDLLFEGFKIKNPTKMVNAFADDQFGKTIGKWANSSKVNNHFIQLYEDMVMENVEFEDYDHIMLNILYSGYA